MVEYLMKTEEFVYQISQVVLLSTISHDFDLQNKGRMDLSKEVMELVSSDVR